MAQVYKMMLGTSGRQWEQLTVKDDGTMMLYFHGTDRSVTQEVTVITGGEWKGWLRSEKGSLYPGLESGKWQAMAAQMRNEELVINKVALTSVKEMRNENEEMKNEMAVDEPVIVDQPRPRRQRKQRKPRVALDGRTAEHTSDISHQPSDTLKAVGMVAAATVALFVIYETGLLIPLGIIGLTTSGLLK